MNKDPKISNIQMRALIVSTIIGVGILSLPNQLAGALDKDGWIAIIISTVSIMPVLMIINTIFKDNAGKDFFEIGKVALGKPIFIFCLIIYLMYYIAVSAFVVRVLGDLIKGFLLTNTPIQLIIVVFLLAVSYSAISEIDVIARVAYLTYPLVIGLAILLILLALPGADYTNILPVFQSDIKNLPEALRVAVFSFSGFEILLFCIPYAEQKEKVFKTSIKAILVVGIIYLVLFFATLTQFSIDHIKADPYPLLMVAKLIDLPGYFLQNLDGLVMAIWVLVIFSTVLPLLYSSGKILGKLFDAKSHKYFVLILIPVIYVVSAMPKNITELNPIIEIFMRYSGLLVTTIIPLAILVVGRIRRRKKQ